MGDSRASGRLRAIVGVAAVTLGGCYHAFGTAGSEGADAAERRASWLGRVSESFAHQASPMASCAPESEDALAERAAARVRHETEAEARWALAVADAPLEASPEIRIGTQTLDDFRYTKGGVTVGLRAPFARPGTLAARRDALVQEAEATRWSGRERERTVVRDTRLAAARAAAWAAFTEIDRQLLAGTEAELTRLSQGAATHSVLAQVLADAETRRAVATATLASAEAERDAWGARVAALTGSCGAVAADVTTWTADAVPDEVAAVAGALAWRPALAERQTERFAAEARMYQARAAAWPWLDWVQVAWEGRTADPSPLAWSFGLSIDVPIFAWGGGAVAASEAELRYLDERAGAEAASVGAEVRAALGMVRTQTDRVARVTAAAQSIDRARIATLERGAQAGAVDAADVWSTKQRLLGLERQRVEALLALREAQIELAHAIGKTAP